MRRTLALALPLLSTPLFGQQFTYQPGLIPGTPEWTEGVEAADVDNDGDFDLFFADGRGFSGPQTQEQNRLVINQLELAPDQWSDESVTRLGANTSHGKMVVTADIDDDGNIDALFLSAWDTDTPLLYVNNGANPGFFTLESAARGFTEVYSSGGAQFGDVDDDGDLDVVIADAYLNSGFGKPHLFLNDGNGVFTEDLTFFATAPNKQACMDVQLVDIDGDFDLDVLAACRAENGAAQVGDHHLLRNDGTGVFNNNSGAFPDGSSGQVYELEVGDLDGDDDLDAFLTSLSGFSDGPIWNNGSGQMLSFATGTALGGDDDNEIALFDYDMDGDYDAIIGSLGAREKLARNDGGMNFTQLTTVIQSVGDSTLDVTVVDVDNDGDYDLVTAQGESNQGQWANKIYLNSGPADTLAPTVVRRQPLVVDSATGPFSFWVEARDQVMDDGRDWVQGAVRYVVLRDGPQVNRTVTAGGLFGGTVNVDPGTLVVVTNGDGVAHSIESATASFDYSSGTLLPGDSATIALVEPGTYTFTDGVGGLTAETIVVAATGSILDGDAQKQPGGLYRMELANVAPPFGIARIVYELSFTDDAGNVTRVSDYADSRGTTPTGCGINPAGSLTILEGFSTPGATLSFGLDNPLGTQAIGSLPILAITGNGDPASPCGTPLPGFGMSGGFGELLVSLAPPFPAVPLQFGTPWAGPGAPSTITVTIPGDPTLVGLDYFAQGVLLDSSGTGPRFGLTNGFDVNIR